MPRWFAKLMQKSEGRSRRVLAGAAEMNPSAAAGSPGTRDARYGAIVQQLRDRESEDRAARERRQRWYRQYLKGDAPGASSAASPWSPSRLHRIRTKVPCRTTPQASALLDQLRKRFSGCTVSFPQLPSGQQAVMVTGIAGAERKQIGWIEHHVEPDPQRCNVRNHGLIVDTDGDAMLVLRFQYPATSVTVSTPREAEAARPGEAARAIDDLESSSLTTARDEAELPGGPSHDAVVVDFAELRPALDLRPSERSESPRLVWITRPERETMNALHSRDYEAFYLRFKRELLAGIWSSLSGLLASAPASQWHRGSHFSVVREPDAATFRIQQKTVDDSGRAVDIGFDRIYDAAPATDILLLFLEGDILADITDIYFTLQSLGEADAYWLKEELFTIVRRFWAGSRSLASRYGSDHAAVVRMSQRAVPMPAQIPLVKQDWTTLRQLLVDRYGAGGCKAAELTGQGGHRPPAAPLAWPFSTFPSGDVNLGLRLVYRQEWRYLGAQRGNVIRASSPATPSIEAEHESMTPASAARRRTRAGRSVETTVVRGDAPRNLAAVVDDAVRDTIDAMKWTRDIDGRVAVGVRDLAARAEAGLESESRENSHDTRVRLGDMMRRSAGNVRVEAPVATAAASADAEPTRSDDPEGSDDGSATTCIHSRLQDRYEVLTRPAELENVVMVAERLPTPADIGPVWIQRHDWILAKALLDESYRESLDTIGREAPQMVSREQAGNAPPVDDEGRDERAAELQAGRERLYEHVRANILHYQRAIWRQEDPQQRAMRYRKSCRKVPLEWRFELESGGALTIDALGDRLAATNVDGQFTTYAGGRDAYLDQLIDPARPIGYYANYAIYRMRPEFGSSDAFAMLHFFKSPYLRFDADAAAPVVDDPELIALAGDPALVEGADRVRRERAQRFALDTDGVVIDFIRTSVPACPDATDVHVETQLAEAPADCTVTLDGARALELPSSSARAGGRGTASIGGRDGDQKTMLRAGARGSGGDEPLIVPPNATGSQYASIRGTGVAAAGAPPRAVDSYGNHRIFSRDDAAPPINTACRAAAAGANSIVVGDVARQTKLLVGRTDSASGAIMVGDGAGGAARELVAGSRTPVEHEQLIVVRDDAGLARTMLGAAGASPDPESLVLAAGPSAPPSRALVGRRRETPDERVIATTQHADALRNLVAGRMHDFGAERLQFSRGGGELRLDSTAAGATPPHERAIVAREGEFLRPSLVTG